MNIEKLFYAEDATKPTSTKPMALGVMQMMLPDVATRIVNRRFGLDGQEPMSTEQVALRYGLPVPMVKSILFGSITTISDMGLDLT